MDGVSDSISSDLASEFSDVEFGKELLKKLKEDDAVSADSAVSAAGPIPHLYGVQSVSQSEVKYDDMMKADTLKDEREKRKNSEKNWTFLLLF